MKTVRLDPAADLTRELPRLAHTRVELADGIYFLSDTLRVPGGLTLAAAPGARPVISGGQRLTGWRVENGRWTLPVDYSFTQLFVNGERRPRARLPKTGFYEFESLPDGRTTEWYQGATRVVYAPGDCANWQHLADVRLVALQMWFEIHLRLAAVDEATRTLTFVTRAFHNLHDETGRNARYYVENVLEALTEPGEWCLSGGMVHYIPRPGETPENTEIIAPRLATLARLEDCRDARLEGLEFRHADWELPAANTGAVQAAFNVPGAIQLRRAIDCVIQHCTVAQVAGYGIEVQLGSTGNRILDCELHDLGAGGVKINHERPVGKRETEDNAFTGLDVVALGWASERDAPSSLEPSRTEIARCRIHDGGKIFHSAVGVWIGDAGFNHVHHNEIFDLYYTGISCGWSWNYAPTRCIGNVIECNHVYHIGRKLLSDMGAIYLLGCQPGGVVRGNHVHDVSCYGYGGSGIYPDQGSSFLTIEDNLVHHTQTDALSIHFGQGLTVRNNIFALTGSGLIARGREECVLLGVFERNILSGATTKMLGYNWNLLTTLIFRNNTYWVADGAPPDFFGMTFAEWMQQGHDTGSVVADPGADICGRGIPAPTGRDKNVAPTIILEPRLELGEPTFPTAADGERLTTFPATLFVTADEPQQLSLTLTNHGPARARGRGEFAVAQPGVTLTGEPTFDFDLAPGARAVFAIHATLPAAVDEALILVRAPGGEFPVVGLCLTRRQEFRIARLAAIPDVNRVAATLASQPAREFRVRGLVLGNLRMAIAGDRLALALKIRETKLQPNPAMPWAGSGIELFFDSPASPLKAAQYFIWPGGTARMDHHTMKVVAETGIAVAHQPTADGYTLMALVPWSYVGAAADATEFRCELHLNATPPGARNQLQAKLFSASFSWMGMDGWGAVRVAE